MVDVYADPIDSLTLDDLRALLAEASDGETYTFEAKADDPAPTGKGLSSTDVSKAACAFANSRVGGVVVVGAAELSRGQFALTGLAHPRAGSLKEWLDKAVDGVRPRPRAEIRTFDAEPPMIGPAAIVRVFPVMEKPAIANGGRIYVRTATQSVPLEDPVEINRLFRESEAEVAAGRRRAAAMAGRMPDPEARGPAQVTLGLEVAAAPLAVPPELAARLFRPSAVDHLVPMALDREVGASGLMSDMTLSRMREWGVFAWRSGPWADSRWVAEVGATGWSRVVLLVPVTVVQEQETASASRILDGLRTASKVLVGIMGQVGMAGAGHLLVSTYFGPHGPVHQEGPVDDVADLANSTEVLLRGVSRGMGLRAFET